LAGRMAGQRFDRSPITHQSSLHHAIEREFILRFDCSRLNKLFMISTVMLVLGLGLGLEPQVLVNITVQERNHAFKVGGPVPWSRVLLPFYRKKQVYPVWCNQLYNHTLFIKKLRKTWGVRPNFLGVQTSPTPSGCAHDRVNH